MKNILLTIAALLLLATAAQAKKTPIEFCPGVEGYISNPEASYYVFHEATTNEEMEVWYSSHISIQDTTAKDTITFTKIDPAYNCEYLSIYCSEVKSIAYKSKDSAYVSYLGSSGEKLTVKMPNVYVEDFECNSFKTAQFGSARCVYQDLDYSKGTVLKVADFLTGNIVGCYKSITAGNFGLVEGKGITTPKTLVLKAKNPGGIVYLRPDVKCKAKNVDVGTYAPAD